MIYRIVLVLLIVTCASLSVQADTLKLKSGKVVQGKIIERNSRSLSLDVGLEFPITYYIDEITAISKDSDPVPVPAVQTVAVVNPNISKADKTEREGLELIDQGQMASGLALLRDAIRLDARGNRYLNLGSILVGNGVSLQREGKSQEALETFKEAEVQIQQSLKLFNPDQETTFISEAYNVLGEMYANALNDKAKAKAYYEKSLSFYENPAAKRGLDGL